ncbi:MULTISPECIES: sensor histidine kinase [Cryobacterium]|uniref:Sensor histidine kinase n=1 Tax=Cryobacterium breve TaxID=1259258 RepID=A0ABY2IVP6_9MICO|nr:MULTISPECIES: sensor histidine kinase [Cryobacterium]TFC93944.1 sensor histidine kinase [Cryobacterium sp. TmT3-12]TFC95117.1 sensor histidine kinase [Cryobacterium breve]
MSRPAIRAWDFRHPAGATAAEKSEVRSAVFRFLLIGLTVLIAVSIPVSLWIRAQAESHTLDDATVITHHLADYTVGPLITDQAIAGDPAALKLLDIRVAPWLADRSIVRVKVWDAQGRVLYSDVPSLIGRTFELPGWSGALLAGGAERASLERQEGLDNDYEADSGELVEIYVRAVDAAGRPLIIEAYFDDQTVHEEQASLLLSMTPAFLLSLMVLQLAQLPPAIRLARRIQVDQAARRQLLQHAIRASDLERRRIARDLHDEVIQDLAGLSYALEAEDKHGSDARSALIVRARLILQRNVSTLREMTGELYPPDLERLGLIEGLRRLADPLTEQGIEVGLSLPERLDLDRDRSAILYRVAREALTNAMKHARAHRLELTVTQDAERIRLCIRDDGRGFDPDAQAPDGHVGLRIIRDTIRVTGGTLEISSRGGHGTLIVAAIDRA